MSSQSSSIVVLIIAQNLSNQNAFRKSALNYCRIIPHKATLK